MLGRLLALAAITSGCYSIPEPDCGFVCGPGGACPADYTCAADRICHRNGAPSTPTCASQGSGLQVVSLDPGMNATGVPVDQVVRMYVNENLLNVDPMTFVLFEGSSAVTGTVDFQPSSLSAEFDPSAPLAPETVYTMVVSAGITDDNGESLAPFSWSFMTGADTVAPRVLDISPMNGESNVPIGTIIGAFFSEPVMGVDTASFTVSDGVTPVVGTITSNGQLYELRPSANLSPATNYTTSLTNAIQDVYGNPLAPVTFSFTTQ